MRRGSIGDVLQEIERRLAGPVVSQRRGAPEQALQGCGSPRRSPPVVCFSRSPIAAEPGRQKVAVALSRQEGRSCRRRPRLSVSLIPAALGRSRQSASDDPSPYDGQWPRRIVACLRAGDELGNETTRRRPCQQCEQSGGPVVDGRRKASSRSRQFCSSRRKAVRRVGGACGSRAGRTGGDGGDPAEPCPCTIGSTGRPRQHRGRVQVTAREDLAGRSGGLLRRAAVLTVSPVTRSASRRIRRDDLSRC